MNSKFNATRTWDSIVPAPERFFFALQRSVDSWSCLQTQRCVLLWGCPKDKEKNPSFPHGFMGLVGCLYVVCSRKFLHSRCSKWRRLRDHAEHKKWESRSTLALRKCTSASGHKIDIGSCHANSWLNCILSDLIFHSISLPHHVLRHQGINVVVHRFWVSHLSACSASNLAEDLGRSFLEQEAVRKNGVQYTVKTLAIRIFYTLVSASEIG